MIYYLTFDAKAVHRAALWLNIAEFELFRRAHAAWYRESPCERELERYFVSYLFEGRVPVWVRDFSRRTIRDMHARARLAVTHSSQVPQWRIWLCASLGAPIGLATGLDRRAPDILAA